MRVRKGPLLEQSASEGLHLVEQTMLEQFVKNLGGSLHLRLTSGCCTVAVSVKR